MEISKKVFDNRLRVYYNVDRVFARCVMLVNVQKIINAPGERIDFQFSLDLSDVDFGGLYPAQNPVVVTGDVRNTAGMLLLRFSADTVLKSVCDRCLENFDNPKRVACEYLLAQELADAENDDIVLLEDGAVDVGDLARTAMITVDSSVFRGLQGALPRLRRQPQPRELHLSEGSRPPVGGAGQPSEEGYRFLSDKQNSDI